MVKRFLLTLLLLALCSAVALAQQMHYFKSNTPHGFKNPNSTPVTFVEIFVKNAGRAGNINPQIVNDKQETQSWLRKMVP